MTPSDLLLFWLSGFPEVSLDRVSRACHRLADPPALASEENRRTWLRRWRWRLCDPLPRLGHVEPVEADCWRVVPPTLVWLPAENENDGEGYLCGARSPGLQRELHRDKQLALAEPEPQPHEEGPARWSVRGRRSDVEAAAQKNGVHFTTDRGDEVLAALPALADLLEEAEPASGLPEGLQSWELEGKPVRGRWVAANHARAAKPGVFRTAAFPRQWYARLTPEHLVCLESTEQRLAAQWRLVRSACRLCYQRAARQLMVPAAGVLLPMLVDRLLRLPSGRSPTRSPAGEVSIYRNVDFARARETARVLGLRLETLP